MKLSVGQIYIEPGVTYPFSGKFQVFLGKEMTQLVEPSERFSKKYSDDFNVKFRLSAKAGLAAAEIRGPSTYRKTKDIEFSIFLPHTGEAISINDQEKCRQPLVIFFECVATILESLFLDPTRIRQQAAELTEKIISDPLMFCDD